MTPVAEKLVRDRIPALIAATGGLPVSREAAQDERLALGIAKLREEVEEFVQAPCLAELADIVEVARALACECGGSPAALERVRSDKAAVRGGFGGWVVLRL